MESRSFLKNIRSNGDSEFITKQVLLDAIPVIGPSIADVINSSLEFAICPKNWKNSIIHPTPKVPGTIKCDELRPINTLPTYEKILEAAVKEFVEEHMENNNITIDEQSGFRRGYSCESALNLVIMKWRAEIDKGNIVVAVFLDLKRAFETIDRKRLLEEMEKLGIKGRELEWFRSYLSERTQCTKINGVISEKASCDIVLPQGSKLAAILFSLYINDIKLCLMFMSIVLFADDTLVYYSGKDINEINRNVNEDLERLNRWVEH